MLHFMECGLCEVSPTSYNLIFRERVLIKTICFIMECGLCEVRAVGGRCGNALCGGEGDIQGLRGGESKLERCQLVAAI